MGFLNGLRRVMNPDIFNSPIGNDLPEQGGITGTMNQGFDMPDFRDVINQGMDMNMPDLTPVSAQDPDGGTLPSTNPMTQGMPVQAPVLDPKIINPRPDDPRMVGDVPVEESPEDFIHRRMAALYTPEHSASDQFNQLLAQYPVRQKPRLLAKIAASMYGMDHGPEGADKLMYGDYYRQLADWKNKIGPTEQAANLERYMNSNERQYANQEVQRELQEEENRRKQRKDEESNKIAQETLKVRQQRAATYDWKTRHPDMKIQEDNEGNLIGVDPQSGKVQYITDDDGDPVVGSKLSDKDRINLEIQGRKDVAKIQQSGANYRAGVAKPQIVIQGGGTSVIDPNKATSKPVIGPDNQPIPSSGKLPGGGGANAGKPPSSKEIMNIRKQRAQELIAADPNNKKYLSIDPTTGAYMINPPSGGMFGGDATPEQLAHAKYLRDYIYGNTPGGPTNQLPPPEKRVVGQIYTMGNGKPGKWTGKGFIAAEGQ